MIELFQDPLITGLLGTLFGTLVGSLLGHRFSLDRDKRKEKIELAQNLYNQILDFIESGNSDSLPSTRELKLYSLYIPLLKRNKFLALITEFKLELKRDNEAIIKDPINGDRVKSGYESKTKSLATKIQGYFTLV
ncbi:TPA: hypothetical protein ACPVZM_002968 [Vibrio parahaemolyticus]